MAMVGRWLRRRLARWVEREVAAEQERAEQDRAWLTGEDGYSPMGAWGGGWAGRCGRCRGPRERTVEGRWACPDCDRWADYAAPPGITAV